MCLNKNDLYLKKKSKVKRSFIQGTGNKSLLDLFWQSVSTVEQGDLQVPDVGETLKTCGLF